MKEKPEEELDALGHGLFNNYTPHCTTPTDSGLEDLVADAQTKSRTVLPRRSQPASVTKQIADQLDFLIQTEFPAHQKSLAQNRKFQRILRPYVDSGWGVEDFRNPMERWVRNKYLREGTTGFAPPSGILFQRFMRWFSDHQLDYQPDLGQDDDYQPEQQTNQTASTTNQTKPPAEPPTQPEMPTQQTGTQKMRPKLARRKKQKTSQTTYKPRSKPESELNRPLRPEDLPETELPFPDLSFAELTRAPRELTSVELAIRQFHNIPVDIRDSFGMNLVFPTSEPESKHSVPPLVRDLLRREHEHQDQDSQWSDDGLLDEDGSSLWVDDPEEKTDEQEDQELRTNGEGKRR